MKNTELSDVHRPRLQSGGNCPEKFFFWGPRPRTHPGCASSSGTCWTSGFTGVKITTLLTEEPSAKPISRHPNFLRSVETFRNEVQEILHRFQSEVPNYSPRYIGHMTTEISLPALVGHMLTLLYNPNNISEEVSRVGLQVEKNAIGALLAMVGYDQSKATGHFTSGGTVANIEGALRARARMRNWICSRCECTKATTI